MTNFGQWSDLKPLNSVTCPIFAERKFFIEVRSVANLKMKKPERWKHNCKQHCICSKISITALGNLLFDCNPFWKLFFVNWYFFSFYKNLNFWIVISVKAPNMLNICIWSRRMTFLCLNTWSISGSGTIFTTLHFLRTSQINPIS